MTTYCNIGDNPKVYFKFNGESEQIYQSKASPIDVSLENYSIYGENYSENGYTISIYSTNNFGTFSYVVRNYNIVDRGDGYPSDQRYELFIQTCASDSLSSVFLVNPSTLVISPSPACPAKKPDVKKSRLHIKKVGTSTDIFTAEGNYPATFRVACGDCPEGFCRCECDSYPGYCCIDAKLLTGELKGLKNIVQGLNKKGSVSHG